MGAGGSSSGVRFSDCGLPVPVTHSGVILKAYFLSHTMWIIIIISLLL